MDLSNSIVRVKNGMTLPIPPSEFVAWRAMTGNIVYPVEYDIMRAMDDAFCALTAQEVKSFQARDADRRAQDKEETRRGQRNR